MIQKPIKMRYRNTGYDPWIDIDVYAVHYTDELECFVLGWNPHARMWVTVPVFLTEPVEEKKSLNEDMKTDGVIT